MDHSDHPAKSATGDNCAKAPQPDSQSAFTEVTPPTCGHNDRYPVHPQPLHLQPLHLQPALWDVAFLPSLILPGSLVNRTVIVTDVLRATTTIIAALTNGGRSVLPQPSIEAARNKHQQIPGSILGGERGGKIVDGFHHGNSPIEYTSDVISGKDLILATTNGTVAMESCRRAKKVLIGAMVNIAAIVDQIDSNEPVTVVCSGTDGEVTGEDVMFAGALMDRMATKFGEADGGITGTTSERGVRQIGDMARIAINHWQTTCRMMEEGVELAEFFRTARGGINLVKIGHDKDIVFASQIDSHHIVPALDVEQWKIGVS